MKCPWAWYVQVVGVYSRADMEGIITGHISNVMVNYKGQRCSWYATLLVSTR